MVKEMFSTKQLDETTFEDFARAVEKNHIWGGCWCLGFHGNERTRVEKERRVIAGTTHATLVYDLDNVVGWCQFGRTSELPRIKHLKQYQSKVSTLPDWRITCFVVDRDYRRKGVAGLALQASLHEIRSNGGGLVESYPEDVDGRKVSSSFLYNTTVSLFERNGFVRQRRLGRSHWVVTRLLEPEGDLPATERF